MADKNYKGYPVTRISLEDGMAVTAQIWGDAHNYHALRQRYHELLLHGSGIVTGLEVSPSVRPFMVDLKPGIAIDPAGDIISVLETKTYQIGSTPGLLYLVLSYGESSTKAGLDGPRTIRSECIIQAVSELPAFPHVEIARILLADGAPIRNAIQPDLPGPNELDLRFRPLALVNSAQETPIARIGVCYTAKSAQPEGDGHGAVLLARGLRAGGVKVWVDDNISLDPKQTRPDARPALDMYTLIYLVGGDRFLLNELDVAHLKDFVRRGGTLLIEPCRRDHPEGNSPAGMALWNLANSLGSQLTPLTRGQPLLMSHHLFSAFPPGFESDNNPAVLAGDGIIYSTSDYGCLWRGDRRGRPASREEIRTASEWGENLLAYALQRKGLANR